LNEQIKQKLKQLKNIQIAKLQLKQLKQTREDFKRRLLQIDQHLRKKHQIIERLNNVSILSLYKKVIGKLNSDLDLYKQNYLKLSIEYNDLAKSLDLLEYEIGILTNKATQFQSVKNELKVLLLAEEKLITIGHLKRWRSVVKKIEFKLNLLVEIEEAIKEGRRINLKFKAAIKYLESIAKEIGQTEKRKSKIERYKVHKEEKYQSYIIEINHGFIKYETELNDVYSLLLESDNMDEQFSNSFVKDYRTALVHDLRRSKQLNNSWKHLKRYKEIVLNFTTVLRKDVRQIKKELLELEKQEVKIIEAILKDQNSS